MFVSVRRASGEEVIHDARCVEFERSGWPGRVVKAKIARADGPLVVVTDQDRALVVVLSERGCNVAQEWLMPAPAADSPPPTAFWQALFSRLSRL